MKEVTRLDLSTFLFKFRSYGKDFVKWERVFFKLNRKLCRGHDFFMEQMNKKADVFSR